MLATIRQILAIAALVRTLGLLDEADALVERAEAAERQALRLLNSQLDLDLYGTIH